jgi:putative inorganic carbon (HCO3(-)) transporter
VMRSAGRQRTLRMALSSLFLLLSLVLVALSGSRESAIAWLATLLAFCLWKPTRAFGKQSLLLLIVAILAAPFVFSTTVNRFQADEGQLGGRRVIWEASWLLVRDHPVDGVGIGNSGSAVAEYVHRITSLFRNRTTIVSHNPILQIWTETGTPGILLYLSVLISTVWPFFQNYRRHRKLGTEFLTPYFALVSCIFLGVMLWWFNGGESAYDPKYFLLLALLLIPSHLCTQKPDRQEERDRSSGVESACNGPGLMT